MDLYTGTVLAGLIFLASLISVELGLSAAIIEITLGVIGGNFFGNQADRVGEVHHRIWRNSSHFPRGSGGRSQSDAREGAGELSDWSRIPPCALPGYDVALPLPSEWAPAKLAGVALSTSSTAVLYAMLVETRLTETGIGKIIMAATFLTDFGTALGLSLIFMTPTVNTVWFGLVSAAIVILAPRLAPILFSRYGGRVIEPEIKFIVFSLLVLVFMAQLGASQAVLPAFVLGLVISHLFHGNRALQRKTRVVAFAFITPIFFLNGGMNISLRLLWANRALFAVLLAVKLITKFAGVFPVSRMLIPREATYATLLSSTGLTMGTISSLFGYQAGIINQAQFSVLVAVVVASAIIPTFFAQRFFHPHHLLEALGSEIDPEFIDPSVKPE